MTRWIALLLMTALMMSCAKPNERKAEFIHEEYAPYVGEGTARICGQAYVTVENGKQHVASGDRVLLAPVTSYTEEAFRVKVLGGREIADPDPEAAKFEKRTKTDTEGRFCFTGLPAGEYYVVADIVLPTSTKEHRESQLAHAKASVKADENMYLLVTR
ncbi:MAG: hypothetical protein WD032_01105 [Nitrospirales bacterium]